MPCDRALKSIQKGIPDVTYATDVTRWGKAPQCIKQYEYNHVKQMKWHMLHMFIAKITTKWQKL